MLSKFDLQYILQKSIKGRVMIDFLADLPIEDQKEENYDFLDEESFKNRKTP